MRFNKFNIGDMVKVHSTNSELDERVGYIGNFVGSDGYIAIVVWPSNEQLNQERTGFEMARLMPVVCLESYNS